MIYRLVLTFGLLILTGCHADITYRIDLRADQTATVTVKEKLDDQFYNLVVNQSKNGDPFGLDKAKTNGWSVEKATDDDNNYVITMSQTMPTDALALTLPDSPNAKTPNKPLIISSANFHIQPGIFTDRRSLDILIPAPMSNDTSSDPYATAGARMAASMIAIHLELRGPGTILDSNGDTTPDGFSRWNIAMTHPTHIEYVVQEPNIDHIVLAAVAIILLASALVYLLDKDKTVVTANATENHLKVSSTMDAITRGVDE